MCVGNEQCQIREMQKMTACRHFFVFFLFDRAVLGAGGTCLARTEVERRCHDNEEKSRSMFSEILAGTAVKASGTGARQREEDLCLVNLCL